MVASMGFEQLCSLFARSLLDKAQAYKAGDLSKFQRSRLGEAMTADIRKLGDMVFPAARTPRVSVAAQQVADAMGCDLRQATWHSQKNIDDYKTFTYEHLYPVRQIRLALAEVSTTAAVLDVLDRMLWVAWITKQEDKRLRDLGFGSVRPNPFEAYAEAGIELLPEEPADVRMGCASPRRECAGCARAGAWLVTGGVESNAPRRLLVYCENCKQERAPSLGAMLPLDVFDQEPQAFLLALYRGGATETDPEHVSATLGVRPEGWSHVAHVARANTGRNRWS